MLVVYYTYCKCVLVLNAFNVFTMPEVSWFSLSAKTFLTDFFFCDKFGNFGYLPLSRLIWSYSKIGQSYISVKRFQAYHWEENLVCKKKLVHYMHNIYRDKQNIFTTYTKSHKTSSLPTKSHKTSSLPTKSYKTSSLPTKSHKTSTLPTNSQNLWTT